MNTVKNRYPHIQREWDGVFLFNTSIAVNPIHHSPKNGEGRYFLSRYSGRHFSTYYIVEYGKKKHDPSFKEVFEEAKSSLGETFGGTQFYREEHRILDSCKYTSYTPTRYENGSYHKSHLRYQEEGGLFHEIVYLKFDGEAPLIVHHLEVEEMGKWPDNWVRLPKYDLYFVEA